MKFAFPNQNLFAILFALLLAPSLSIAQNKPLLDNKQWIDFEWDGMKLGSRYFRKAAMQVPFTIDGINDKFYFQLDLGATSSMLYGNSINYYLAKNSTLVAGLDTVHKKYMIEGKMQGGFTELKTHIDGDPFTFNNMAYFKGFGDSITTAPAPTAPPQHMGTLGAPFFADKVLIIDYPNHRFAVLNELDKATSDKFEFQDCRLENSRIKIPFTINGTVYWLMFDTGSSLFSIMTNKKYYDEFIGNTPVDSLGIPSWGKTLEVYGKKMNKPMQFGSLKLPQNNVYMINDVWDDFYKSENIIGLTGNALFLDKVIAIDFKNKKFGVYKYGAL
jgi:hypothetical protein